MGSESTFERLTNHILESAELVINRMEEGFSILMPEKPPETRDGGATGDGIPYDNTFMDMDEDMMGSPLEGIADGVLKDIMSSNIGPETPMEHLQAFSTAINWTEPFILSLIAFQIVIFLLFLWMSRKGFGMVPRLVLMCSVGLLVRCAEYLNGLAARNWQSFATQNYFDRNGIFIGLFLCGPLLLDCFIMLTLLIREASQLLIDVKRMEITKKKKGGQEKGDKKKGETGKGGKKKRGKKTKKED
mmetsp:Transcript_42774/g.48606  ORF Transcript_42774/g.48606 Transcript_42774/m.48606 type:complete len:245 (+) Transcript_42774:55-789(+)|eukprot:CAMPEP_0194170968 /NCGR_PEP_ID=MMETSP0154-20130528/5606_1 /TAXON_ID=1049557 /ORGANISM="Thalassiothrix antarctica, Strain L6-D1" /LENGTH=244 /DNA_ID=CAMNT_0038883075 /DNA_START=55 /DNA_END=789 /DNA_ORIENTATION=-